jgi:hypothetical protein
MVLIALDFGRLFYSYVTVTNAARVAANYAGSNPDGPFGSGSNYATLVGNEGLNTLSPGICNVGGFPPAPAFADSAIDSNSTSRDFGDTATVIVGCNFKLLTPIIGDVVGNPLPIRAAATFPIRTGVLQ